MANNSPIKRKSTTEMSYIEKLYYLKGLDAELKKINTEINDVNNKIKEAKKNKMYNTLILSK